MGTSMSVLFDNLSFAGKASTMNTPEMVFRNLTVTLPVEPIAITGSVPGSTKTQKYKFSATNDSFEIDTPGDPATPLTCTRS
jgi:hypothetical protein